MGSICHNCVGLQTRDFKTHKMVILFVSRWLLIFLFLFISKLASLYFIFNFLQSLKDNACVQFRCKFYFFKFFKSILQ